MRYEEVINDRRSARGYLDKPVPKAVLEEVIKLATRAPSSMNTQPWHFHVITGTALDNIRNCLLYTSPSPRDRTRSRMPSSA